MWYISAQMKASRRTDESLCAMLNASRRTDESFPSLVKQLTRSSQNVLRVRTHLVDGRRVTIHLKEVTVPLLMLLDPP